MNYNQPIDITTLSYEHFLRHEITTKIQTEIGKFSSFVMEGVMLCWFDEEKEEHRTEEVELIGDNERYKRGNSINRTVESSVVVSTETRGFAYAEE